MVVWHDCSLVSTISTRQMSKHFQMSWHWQYRKFWLFNISNFISFSRYYEFLNMVNYVTYPDKYMEPDNYRARAQALHARPGPVSRARLPPATAQHREDRHFNVLFKLDLAEHYGMLHLLVQAHRGGRHEQRLAAAVSLANVRLAAQLPARAQPHQADLPVATTRSRLTFLSVSTIIQISFVWKRCIRWTSSSSSSSSN